MITDDKTREKKFSIHAYDQFINSSRKGSVNSSQMSDDINQSLNDQDQQIDLSQKKNAKKSSFNQSQQNFTLKLQHQRKLSSQSQVLNAFNSIRDMNNKDQINKALLMITQVKDRIVLVEKLLERREQITKAKEMQAINNLAPLFNKIKAKFMSSLEKRNELKKERKPKAQSTIVISQKDQNESAPSSHISSQQQIEINGNPIRSANRLGSRKKTGVGTIIPHSPTSRNNETQKEEETSTLQQQNKNIMGAITIFATHDIRMDKDKEEQEKKQKQNKILGYLQRDNILRGGAPEDRIKSPSKSNKRKSNVNQSTNNAGTTIIGNGTGNNTSPNPLQGKKKDSLSNNVSVISPTSGIPTGIDYNQKMQALKKKMFQVGSGVGRRESPSSSGQSNKHFRVRSLNGSPSSYMKQMSGDAIKMDESQKYFFKPQLNNFSSATHNYQNHSSSQTNLNNFSLNSQKSSHHRRSTAVNHQNDGILYDFIIECEQKRLLQKSPQLNNDPIIAKRLNMQSQNGIKPPQQPFKTSIVPCRNLQAKQSQGNNGSGSVLQKLFFMRRQYSNSSIKTPPQMYFTTNPKSPKFIDNILDNQKLDEYQTQYS